MTNEIPKAPARNNGLFGWLEAVWEVVVVVVVVEGVVAKTSFQPLQLSRLSLLVLRLTPGSALRPVDQGDVCGTFLRACVCVCVCVCAPWASRDIARRFSVLSQQRLKNGPDTKDELNGVKTPSVWSRPRA